MRKDNDAAGINEAGNFRNRGYHRDSLRDA